MTGTNKKRITEILKRDDNIRFAYIFGSQVKSQTRLGSDLDIGVYFEREPDLNDLGILLPGLEDTSGCKVDLISLKGLYIENPKLAYSVVAGGVLLFTKDETLHTQFKKNVFLYYLDFKPVIDLFTEKLYQRLDENKFAVAEPRPTNLHPGKSND